MTRRGWIISLVLAGLAGVVVLAQWRTATPATPATPATAPTAAPSAMADNKVATPQAPARLCTNHPQAALRGLREGVQRAVVVIKAFQPPRQGGSGLVVSLLSANGTKRHELTRVAVHPLQAFTARDASQRFLVSLAPVAHLIDDGKPLCIEVGFDTAGGTPDGGMAEVDIELAKMP